jgi:DNA-directed RNA polymerase sigma subunit (sigma70/sigma32)
VSCRHHLYLDVTETGGLKLNFPDRDPDELAETCALDVADQNGATLEQIGEYMNFTRERSRQLEALVQIKLRRIAHGPSSPTQKLLRELSDGMKRRDD